MQCQLREAVADICRRRRGRPLDPPARGPVERTGGRWGIGPFYVSCGDGSGDGDRHSVATQATTAYNFETETTYDNLYRLLRAMQLSRPILLEGSPGVGKTTLIEAMSRAVGKEFVRINLSDQTDMMDLLGANLPSPEGDAGEFVWSDGPLLQAMKTGSWVLLDELNLAGQSILEGLNALLDHRGEIFVPELNTVVKCAPGFRLFGAQNPVQEGGGRKGLPKSFLNRFIPRPDLGLQLPGPAQHLELRPTGDPRARDSCHDRLSLAMRLEGQLPRADWTRFQPPRFAPLVQAGAAQARRVPPEVDDVDGCLHRNGRDGNGGDGRRDIGSRALEPILWQYAVGRADALARGPSVDRVAAGRTARVGGRGRVRRPVRDLPVVRDDRQRATP